MVKITHTNIIVDEFSTARYNPFNTYVHFLSHIHMDHLKGLSNSWDYGPIYCSPITKQLILLKYPRLNCLKQLQLDKQHTIALSSELEVTVTLFDSNHCAGSVMILFEGFMGTVLYSGDMRYDKTVYSQYNYLYPHTKRNKEFRNCSIPIDFLYLDTTFLHPKFSFPSKNEALKQLDDFVQSTIDKAKEKSEFVEFYIGIDSFGKEEVLVHLAEKFHTLITVSEERYKNISTVGLDSDCFSTDPEAGFIHVILKREMKDFLKMKPNSMGIILTGWANKAHYRNSRLYAIPYSLHSSYPELVSFVDSLRPTFIESILETKPTIKGARQQESVSQAYQNTSENLYEEIETSEFLNKLRNEFTSKPSEELSYLINNVEFQKKIKQKLKLDRTSAEINREEFGMTTTVARVENLGKAGVRFKSERNEQEIQNLKEKLHNKKEELKNKMLIMNPTKRQPKRIQYIGLANQNSQSQNLVEIEDSSSEVIPKQFQPKRNESKSSKSSRQKEKQSSSGESSKENIEMENQKTLKRNQDKMEIEDDEDAELTRKNKWKKKVDSGEIDLFGSIPTISQKQPISKLSVNQTRALKPSHPIFKQQNPPSQNCVIQILDEESDGKPIQSNSNTHSENTNSNTNSRRTKEKKGLNENSHTRVYHISNDNISFDEPAERPSDQRTITQFFQKSRTLNVDKKQSQILDANDSSQKINKVTFVKEKEKSSQVVDARQEHQNQQIQEQGEHQERKDEYQAKIIPLRNCNEFSFMDLKAANLAPANQASANSYKNFFVSNRK